MSSGLVTAMRHHAALIKVAHSVFALPFALLALLVATHGRPGLRLLLLVAAAVVAARTAAMAYNRFVDRHHDARNPRTRDREIPRGVVRPGAALALALVAGAAFIALCFLIRELCGWLSLPVLGWLFAYSHTKRFTAFCHLWLGVSLGLAPVAAWVAATGSISAGILPAVVLGGGVTFWVAGFDLLYACQDEGFDRDHGLHSIPAAFGARSAMLLARVLHGAALLSFAAFGALAGLHRAYVAGLGCAALLLWWQHSLLSPGDLRRIDMAFFLANGALSILLFCTGCLDLYMT